MTLTRSDRPVSSIDGMSRTPKILVLSLAATLTFTGCGVPTEVTDIVGAEVVALEEVGYTADETGEAPAEKPRTVRKLLRRNALHGEVVVQGRDDQVRTVVVQRGEVTTVTGTGFTVKSSDGFELTWTYGENARVIKQREKIGRDAVRTGVRVGVGGARDGSATTARLVVVG